MFDNLSKIDGKNPLDRLLERCDGAYAPRTLKGYETDLRFFEAWCAGELLSWLPAEPQTVARFVEEQIASYRISTIKRRVAAIAFAHRMFDLANPVEHSSVHLALRRAKRARPQRPDQMRGLTHDVLEKVLAAHPPTLAGLRDAAMVGVGYDTLCRSSELAAMRIEHIRREGNDAVGLLIPRSKADPAGVGRIGHLSPRTAEALDRWLEAAELTSGPIFQGLHLARPSGRALNTSSIRRIVKRALEAAGLSGSEADKFSGHSMRIGAAQDMMVAGFDLLAIMQSGGWTTPHVAARYVENAATRSLHERRWAALETMCRLPPFQICGHQPSRTGGT